MSFSEWKTYKLGDIAKVQTGPFGSQLHVSDYTEEGVPVVMPVNIGNEKIISEKVMRVSQEMADSLSRHKLNDGDIIFSRRGDVERHAFVYPENKGWLCGTGCLRIVFTREHHSRFVSYQLMLSEKKKWLSNHAVGTTMPNLNTSILSEIELELPDLKHQKRIASILSSLDDKIELNRQTNQTLEAIAQTLFKELCLPKGDELPEGWRVGKLGDFCKNIRTTVNPQNLEFSLPYVGLEHIPRKSLCLDNCGDSSEVNSQKSKFLKFDILFGRLRPYFHKVCIAPTEGVCSTDVLVVRPLQSKYFSFCLNYLFSDELIKYVSSIADGTRMPRVDWKSISEYGIKIPPVKYIEKLNEISISFFEKMNSNEKENKALKEVRDNLLPKLMKGEIKIKSNEI